MTSFQQRHQIDISEKLRSFFLASWNRESTNPNEHTAIDDLRFLDSQTKAKQEKYANQFKFYKIDLGTSAANDIFYVAQDSFEGWLPKVLSESGSTNEEIYQDLSGVQASSSSTIQSTDPQTASTYEEFIEAIILFSDSQVREMRSNGSGGYWDFAVSSITDPQRQETLKTILTEEIKKYPLEVLKNNLSSISIFKELRFPIEGNGYYYGGTYSNKNLFIAVGDTNNDFSRIVLHHEFSSVFLQSFPQQAEELEEQFTKLSGDHYLYIDGGGAKFLVEEGNGLVQHRTDTEELYRKGFCSTYGTSNFEEDVNELAERIFTGDNELWYAYNKQEGESYKYTILRDKVHALVNFYGQIDAQYTLDFFKNL